MREIHVRSTLISTLYIYIYIYIYIIYIFIYIYIYIYIYKISAKFNLEYVSLALNALNVCKNNVKLNANI